jgi:hypothetical protein
VPLKKRVIRRRLVVRSRSVSVDDGPGRSLEADWVFGRLLISEMGVCCLPRRLVRTFSIHLKIIS